jgi:putative Ca2+/H+ antiporter (TMEM165/GDT1 family)
MPLGINGDTMQWQLLLVTFVTVFISELGDKSQLAAIALSCNAKSPWPIFWGATAALLLASFLGVLLGDQAADWLPTHWVKLMAALGFLILGIRLLWPNSDSETN